MRSKLLFVLVTLAAVAAISFAGCTKASFVGMKTLTQMAVDGTLDQELDDNPCVDCTVDPNAPVDPMDPIYPPDPDDGSDDGSSDEGSSDNDGNVKVRICHFPPGNIPNGHIISISQNAVRAHLDHGHRGGNCQLDYLIATEDPRPKGTPCEPLVQ